MNHSDLIQHFGSQAQAARALRTSPQVVQAWKDRGRIPHGWQQAIEAMTDGALKRDVPATPAPSQEAAA